MSTWLPWLADVIPDTYEHGEQSYINGNWIDEAHRDSEVPPLWIYRGDPYALVGLNDSTMAEGREDRMMPHEFKDFAIPLTSFPLWVRQQFRAAYDRQGESTRLDNRYVQGSMVREGLSDGTFTYTLDVKAAPDIFNVSWCEHHWVIEDIEKWCTDTLPIPMDSWSPGSPFYCGGVWCSRHRLELWLPCPVIMAGDVMRVEVIEGGDEEEGSSIGDPPSAPVIDLTSPEPGTEGTGEEEEKMDSRMQALLDAALN